MQKRLWWVVAGLVVAFLFRDRLLAIFPFQREGISLVAVLVALIGGLLAAVVAYTVVTEMKLRAVWQVACVIFLSGILYNMLGHWLGGFAVFGEFWGGFVGGALETAVLWGALYGAKEVWQGNPD